MSQQIAGSLATVGYGTALGIVRAAKERGKCLNIIATETRPQMQGSRLTTYELVKDGFNVSLIADTMVGYMMNKGYIDKVITGADRITRDGYAFNKIGTYQLSVLAEKHGIPFFMAAPTSSFDLANDHDRIVIEKRDITEILKIGKVRLVPKGVNIINPAFDVTPPKLISGIVTNVGVVYPPLVANIKRLIRPHL